MKALIQQVKVWDSFVRIFHWSLVISFSIAYITEEDLLSLHTLAGYVLLSLIMLRVIWGFIGTPYARFADFSYKPSIIWAFIKDTLSLKGKRFLGHNPAGGAMIFLLLITLVLTIVSGMIIYGMEESGAFYFLVDYASPAMITLAEGLHEFLANLSVFLIFIHVMGVLIESFIHRENLIASMIHGNKSTDHRR